MDRGCTVAAVVIARGSCSRGAFAVVGVVVGDEGAVAVAHTEALAAVDGSAAVGIEHSFGTVDYPCMTWHFHCHTAGGVAVAGDVVAVAAAADTQPAVTSGGGH